MGAVFSGANTPEEAMARARSRVKAMSEYQLTEWMEAALPGMQRHFESYQRTRDVAHLAELALAHSNAGVVIDELISRES